MPLQRRVGRYRSDVRREPFDKDPQFCERNGSFKTAFVLEVERRHFATRGYRLEAKVRDSISKPPHQTA
jgi:hypothetical protein